MPRIFLKPNSPEFADKPQQTREGYCEMPGCNEKGDHKAPKDRALSEYYMFCKEHITEYNKAWNFFEGMSAGDVDEHVYNSMYGDRPTWKHGVNGNAEEALYAKAWRIKHGEEGEPPPNAEERKRNAIGESQHSKEFEAMALMGLEPPLTFKVIKLKYRALAMKHHPDHNGGCKKSEELLKHINMAYTVLKLAYENFEKLPDRG